MTQVGSSRKRKVNQNHLVAVLGTIAGSSTSSSLSRTSTKIGVFILLSKLLIDDP
jgi:hypothetical protein